MDADEHWLSIKLNADLDSGVDLRVFSQLLAEIAAGARLIADDRLGLPRRRGRLTPEEKSFAAFRLTGVSKGSVVISMARPLEALGTQLALDAPTDADAIADELLTGLESAASGVQRADAGRFREEAMMRILRSAGRIAPELRIVHRPPGRDQRTVIISLPDVGSAFSQPIMLTTTERVMFGQVQMADVEDGRQRLRAKLPDGSDATMPVSDELAADLPSVLGRLAELHISEVSQGADVVERMVVSFRLLEESEDGPVRPPKSVTDLAREQGLLFQPPPDYASLLADVFPTDEDVDSFEAYLRRRRLIA